MAGERQRSYLNLGSRVGFDEGSRVTTLRINPATGEILMDDGSVNPNLRYHNKAVYERDPKGICRLFDSFVTDLPNCAFPIPVTIIGEHKADARDHNDYDGKRWDDVFGKPSA